MERETWKKRNKGEGEREWERDCTETMEGVDSVETLLVRAIIIIIIIIAVTSRDVT